MWINAKFKHTNNLKPCMRIKGWIYFLERKTWRKKIKELRKIKIDCIAERQVPYCHGNSSPTPHACFCIYVTKELKDHYKDTTHRHTDQIVMSHYLSLLLYFILSSLIFNQTWLLPAPNQTITHTHTLFCFYYYQHFFIFFIIF